MRARSVRAVAGRGDQIGFSSMVDSRADAVKAIKVCIMSVRTPRWLRIVHSSLRQHHLLLFDSPLLVVMVRESGGERR